MGDHFRCRRQEGGETSNPDLPQRQLKALRMDPITSTKKPSFSRHAARLSLVCPSVTLCTFAFLMFSGQATGRRAIAVIASAALCLLPIGLVLALAALLGSSKHRTTGVLAPAVVGLITNGLLLSFVVASFVASRSRQPHGHSDVEAAPVRTAWVGVGVSLRS